MPGLGEFLFGSSDKLRKKQAISNEQMQFLNQMLGMLGGGGGQGGQGGGGFLDYFQNLLGGEGGQGDFEGFAEPFRQQFQNETIPMLAERFAGAGGGMGGGLSSSGFGQSLSSAGSQFNSQLAQLYAGLRSNAAGQMAGLSNTALGTQPFAFSHKPASPGLVQQGFSSFMGGLGGAARGGA